MPEPIPFRKPWLDPANPNALGYSVDDAAQRDAWRQACDAGTDVANAYTEQLHRETMRFKFWVRDYAGSPLAPPFEPVDFQACLVRALDVAATRRAAAATPRGKASLALYQAEAHAQTITTAMADLRAAMLRDDGTDVEAGHAINRRAEELHDLAKAMTERIGEVVVQTFPPPEEPA